MWDNASTHSAVQVNNTRQISFPSLVPRVGPTRLPCSATAQPAVPPVEAAFAFVKHTGCAKARKTTATRRPLADLNGSLRPAGSAPGLLDVRAQPKPPRVDPAAAAAAAAEPRRWPGFPDEPPAGVTETQPTTYLEAPVDGREVLEPQRIVSERSAEDGTV